MYYEWTGNRRCKKQEKKLKRQREIVRKRHSAIHTQRERERVKQSERENETCTIDHYARNEKHRVSKKIKKRTAEAKERHVHFLLPFFPSWDEETPTQIFTANCTRFILLLLLSLSPSPPLPLPTLSKLIPLLLAGWIASWLVGWQYTRRAICHWQCFCTFIVI